MAEEVCQYLTQILSVLDKNEFDEDTKKSVLLENVRAEIKKELVTLAKAQEGSRLLERLFAHCDEPMLLISYLDSLAEHVVDLSFHSFGSRVLECLFTNIDKYVFLQPETGEHGPKVTLKLTKTIAKVQDSFRGESNQEGGGDDESTPGWGWIELISDSKASHVVRKWLDLLLPSPPTPDQNAVPNNKVNQFKKNQKNRRDDVELQLKFWRHILAITEDLLQPDRSEKRQKKLKTAATHAYCSPSIQALLKKLSIILSKDSSTSSELAQIQKEVKSQLKDLLNQTLTIKSDTPAEEVVKTQSKPVASISLSKHKIASHFLEVAIPLLTDSQFYELYVSQFKNHLLELSNDTCANFVLQKMIYSIHQEAQAGLFISELLKHIESLIIRRTGVVIALLHAAATFSVYQKELYSAVLQAVLKQQTSQPKLFVPTLYTVIPNTATKPYLFCQLLLQFIEFPVQFSQAVVHSFMQLSADKIVKLCCDPHGSRVAEAIFNPKFEAKVKEEFFEKVKGNWAAIAMTKNGSRCLDNIFSLVNVKTKEYITSELLAAEKEITNNFYGRFAYFNCKIEQYKLKKEQWKASIESQDKKRKMFDQLLTDEGEQQLTKKRKRDDVSEPVSSKDASTTSKPAKKKKKSEFASEEHQNIMDTLLNKKKPKVKPASKLSEKSSEIDELFATTKKKKSSKKSSKK